MRKRETFDIMAVPENAIKFNQNPILLKPVKKAKDESIEQ